MTFTANANEKLISPWTKWPPFRQTTFSNQCSWMKMIEFQFQFHWNMFLAVQLTISQHWFRWWLVAVQATSHNLDQCWPCSLMHICGTRGRWVKIIAVSGQADHGVSLAQNNLMNSQNTLSYAKIWVTKPSYVASRVTSCVMSLHKYNTCMVIGSLMFIVVFTVNLLQPGLFWSYQSLEYTWDTFY